jgi:hypothetical protein
MSITLLNENEQKRSGEYMLDNGISENPQLESYQGFMILVFLSKYIKECPYGDAINIIKKNGENIYTFNWPKKMNHQNLEYLLGEFYYKTEAYIKRMKERSKPKYISKHSSNSDIDSDNENNCDYEYDLDEN